MPMPKAAETTRQAAQLDLSFWASFWASLDILGHPLHCLCVAAATFDLAVIHFESKYLLVVYLPLPGQKLSFCLNNL